MAEPTPRSQPPPRAQVPKHSNGAAITALVTGVVALLLSWIPGVNLIGFLLGVVAVVAGVIGVRKAADPMVDGKGRAIAGLVTGALALLITVLVYAGIAAFLDDPEVQSELRELQQEADQEVEDLQPQGG